MWPDQHSCAPGTPATSDAGSWASPRPEPGPQGGPEGWCLKQGLLGGSQVDL